MEHNEQKKKDKISEKRNTIKAKRDKAKFYLKMIRYQVMAVIIGGLIAGMMYSTLGNSEDHHTRLIGEWVYIIYEYHIRTIANTLGFYYTIKYYRLMKKNLGTFRKISFLSLTLSPFIIFFLLPFIIPMWDYYHGFMPFPWMMIPFQVPYNGMVMGTDLTAGISQNPNGPAIVLLIYNIYQIIVFTGTIFLGRRWQCSMLCVMNGGHAEAFGVATPFKALGKKEEHKKKWLPNSKQIHPAVRKGLTVIQIYYFLTNITMAILWSIFLNNPNSSIPVETLIAWESANYYIFGLMLMVLGWVLVGGRAYCLYCPAGTMLGIIGRIVGQRINTNLTRCVDCGQCNDACKMSIDINSHAIEGKPVKSINCVGCGACVDACPTDNLEYSTYFLEFYRSKISKKDISIKDQNDQELKE